MKIGITYDLKAQGPAAPGLPDDFQEEFDSPETIEAVAAVLRELGHEVAKLGDGRELLERLLADPPDLVLNTAEGEGIGRSREARVPAVLEMLGIPYTGSDPLTMAATLDKDCARRLVASAGVTVPPGAVVHPGEDPGDVVAGARVPFPVIVKPAWEGSSKGLDGQKTVIDSPRDLPAVVDALQRSHRQPVLVEEFIHGDELTVGVLGNAPPRVLGVMRIVPARPTERFVYNLELKRDVRKVVYQCPAPLPAATREAVADAALRAFRALGCRDVARIDFRHRDGIAYFLEVNPLPGLNPETSDLPIMARMVGKNHAWLIESILRVALGRVGADGSVPEPRSH
jgi:D-alanine-D-alanine ligase